MVNLKINGLAVKLRRLNDLEAAPGQYRNPDSLSFERYQRDRRRRICVVEVRTRSPFPACVYPVSEVWK